MEGITDTDTYGGEVVYQNPQTIEFIHLSDIKMPDSFWDKLVMSIETLSMVHPFVTIRVQVARHMNDGIFTPYLDEIFEK